MNGRESIFVVIDEKESPDWKEILHGFIKKCNAIASVKLGNYRRAGKISPDECDILRQQFKDRRDHLLSLPLNTRSDYIQLTILCKQFADQVMDFAPGKTQISFRDYRTSDN